MAGEDRVSAYRLNLAVRADEGMGRMTAPSRRANQSVSEGDSAR